MTVEFTVPGDPKAWQRAGRGRFGSYTPQAVAKAEELTALIYRSAARGIPADPISRFEVRLDFHTATHRRTDADNMAKLILDALNGYAWADDSQVDHLDVWVHRASKPARTVVRVSTLTRKVM